MLSALRRAAVHSCANGPPALLSPLLLLPRLPFLLACPSATASCRSIATAAHSHGQRYYGQIMEDGSSARLTGLPVVYHPLYSAPQLAPGHRFPMQVFGRIYDRLLQQGLVSVSQVAVPANSQPSNEVLTLVHTAEYLTAFSSCQLDDARVRRIGFGDVSRTPLLVQRTKSEVAGTLLTAQLALKAGLACNTAGGTHHAFPDCGSGFCIINDLAYTAKRLLRDGAVQRVLIVDLDVHQDEPNIFTLSMHCASNFPARKQTSDMDIPLPDGTGDAAYLAAVSDALPSLLNDFRPDLVLYDAGVDVHEHDSLGRLNVSHQGLMRREMLVLDTCLGQGIAVAGYVGGGYAPDLDVLAERHMCLHRAALQMWQDHRL